MLNWIIRTYKNGNLTWPCLSSITFYWLHQCKTQNISTFSPAAQTSRKLRASFLLVQCTNKLRTTVSAEIDCTVWQSDTGSGNAGRSESPQNLLEARSRKRTADMGRNLQHQPQLGSRQRPRPGWAEPRIASFLSESTPVREIWFSNAVTPVEPSHKDCSEMKWVMFLLH